MKKLSLLTLSLLLAVQAMAQTLQLTLEFSKKCSTDSMLIYAAPMGTTTSDMKKMVQDGRKFSAELETSAQGFYSIIAVKGNRQLALPLYVANAAKPVTVKARMDKDSKFSFVSDANNKALSEFGNLLIATEKEMWLSKPTEEKVRQTYGDLDKLTASAKGKKGVAQAVKQYIDVWAYISAYNVVMSLPRILGVRPAEVTLQPSTLLPPAQTALDNEVAALFRLAPYILVNEMPRGASLCNDIETIRTTYKTPAIRTMLENATANAYVMQWNVATDFDRGLAQITEACEKYGLDKRLVEAYVKRKPVEKGTLFPAEVTLKDSLGNVVPFESFKGKYVYVDVWASWCGPCCQEVPHLKKLEAELANKDVVFVSISVDSTEAPWKKKMAELDMHGNQFIDASKKFCEIMNISGIPHFLIYDKEGRLMKQGAPRPSNPETKTLLEGLK